MTYDELLDEAEKAGLIVMEQHLEAHDGLIYNDLILIDKSIKSTNTKACVLAEEIGHYHTGIGNILNQEVTNNVKQELKGRVWAYNKHVGLNGIINAYNARCKSLYDIAEFLNIPEEFLNDAINYYSNKYGLCTTIDSYIIYFIPNLMVIKMIY